MALGQEILYTVGDIEALPEGERAELIDGRMYDLATPTDSHQSISGFLFLEIGMYIRSKEGRCKLRQAPYAVYLNDDDRNYLEPDISVICDSNKIDEKGCHGAPDWVIEVVSPSSIQLDYLIKLFKYRTAGVREYWIVDRRKDQILVYSFEHDTAEQYSFADKVKAGIYEELEIDFSQLEL